MALFYSLYIIKETDVKKATIIRIIPDKHRGLGALCDLHHEVTHHRWNENRCHKNVIEGIAWTGRGTFCQIANFSLFFMGTLIARINFFLFPKEKVCVQRR
jgi:hypothetical protein